MRVLLIHPEDSPRRGPWSRQRWDLIVDLGRSSTFSVKAWEEQYACAVLRGDSFRRGIADTKLARQIFSAGRGVLTDEEGIDWWDLTSLLLVPEAMTVLVARRIAAELSSSAELWTTRAEGPARVLAVLLGKELRVLGDQGVARAAARAMRYARLLRRFSTGQIKEIVLDKYDPGYRWRSRFSATPPKQTEPVTLLPTAYGNVSRMAAEYARLLPAQKFLMVATRPNARQFDAPPNVRVRDLAAYAKHLPPKAEIASLQSRWMTLKTELCAQPEIQMLEQVGSLDPVPEWIRDGLIARNAWREVLRREPVNAVLCGDDSNRYTRLPVLLAAKRNIPTVDFHHGAFDGRYLLKNLPSDVHLAKNEVERDYLVRVCGLEDEKIALGAPPHNDPVGQGGRTTLEKTSAIFFSEPYEIPGMRTEEVYREVLPPLCRLARECGHGVILKLHPFESVSQRRSLIRDILDPADCPLIHVVDGPLTRELLSQAWFGMTVESTTVLDCVRNGIHCFLCGWLAFSPYGYLEQFARFGIGDVLRSVQEVADIPARLASTPARSSVSAMAHVPLDPATLQRLLRSGVREAESAKPIS